MAARKTGIASGYRPNHVFEGRQGTWKMAYVGDLNFNHPPLINPGEEQEIVVRFVKVPPIEQYMQAGCKWQLFEGPKHLIGEGEILEIISR